MCTVVSEQPASFADEQAADVIKDVKDNEIDSLRCVFHALKIEPCRLRLVSTSPVISGENKVTVILFFSSPLFDNTQRLIISHA